MNDQFIFGKAYSLLKTIGVKIYTYKQMNDVGYPFIEMSNMDTDRLATKSGSLQTISLTIEVWGLASERKKLTTIKSKILDLLISNFQVKESEIEDRILPDTSTTDVLLHGILVVPIYLN
jgi:hypothetical protein